VRRRSGTFSAYLLSYYSCHYHHSDLRVRGAKIAQWLKRRDGSISRDTSHTTPKERCPWILKIRVIKRYSHSFRITCDMCAVSLFESREYRYIKVMGNNNNNNNKSARYFDHDQSTAHGRVRTMYMSETKFQFHCSWITSPFREKLGGKSRWRYSQGRN